MSISLTLRAELRAFAAQRIARTSTRVNLRDMRIGKQFTYHIWQGMGQSPIKIFEMMRYCSDARGFWAGTFPSGVSGSPTRALQEYQLLAMGEGVWSDTPCVGCVSPASKPWTFSALLNDDMSIAVRASREDTYVLMVQMPLLAYLFDKQARKRWLDFMDLHVV